MSGNSLLSGLNSLRKKSSSTATLGCASMISAAKPAQARVPVLLKAATHKEERRYDSAFCENARCTAKRTPAVAAPTGSVAQIPASSTDTGPTSKNGQMGNAE